MGGVLSVVWRVRVVLELESSSCLRNFLFLSRRIKISYNVGFLRGRLWCGEQIFLLSFQINLRWRTWPNEVTHLDFLAVRSDGAEAALDLIWVERQPGNALLHLRVILNAPEVYVTLIVLIVI